MKIIDISMEVKGGMLAYPGNPAPKLERYSSVPKNKTNETLLSFGSHAGTHMDAELHVKKGGKSALAVPLESCYGKCRVLDLTKAGKEIRKEHLEKFGIRRGEIILLKTENSLKGYDKFREDFAHIKESAARHLADKGVKAIGFDYLSVQKFNSDEDEVHRLLAGNMVVFEGLNLKDAEEGEYVFAGFPLKINCDGAPVRAALIKE